MRREDVEDDGQLAFARRLVALARVVVQVDDADAPFAPPVVDQRRFEE
jgi:hypothetical protein